MLKIVCFILSLFLSTQVSAQSSSVDCNVDAGCNIPLDDGLLQADKITTTKKAPKEVIVYEIKKDIKPLPECSDERLINAVKEYIADFYSKNKSGNVLARRRQHFIENNIKEFSKENILYYKSEATKPVSEIIMNLKLNGGVIEENILLCKNNSRNVEAGKLFFIVYPYEEDYKVIVVNLTPKYNFDQENSFILKK